MGGGGDSDLPFASKVKFSSRVHLVDKIGKKILRTENRIILTPGSFEKRSPKRVALIINKHGKHISLNLAVSRSSVFSYLSFSSEMGD